MDRSIYLLFIEDVEDDVLLMVRHFRQHGLELVYDVVDTEAGLSTALRTKQYAIILCDYNTPGLGADRSLALIRDLAPHVPAIVVSGSIGEEQAADLMRAGARDIVLKSNLGRLVPAIEREVAAHDEQVRLTARADESERHFTNLVERSIQGIIIRSEFKTLFANEAICRMFGYSLDEMNNIDVLLDLVHPDDRARAADRMVSQLSGHDDNLRFDTQGLRKDKTAFWLDVMVSNVQWFGANAVQIVAIDITERKLAEQAIVERERQYRENFEAAPVAMAWISLDRRYMRTNRACQTLLGYSADELIGMSPAEMSHPDALPEVRRHVDDLIEGRSTHIQFETRFFHKNRSVIWLLNDVSMVHGFGGAPNYLVAHLQDITARKTAEDQLFHAQKMEAIGNFAGGIAHDFNNMLVPIMGLTEVMKEDLPADSSLQENLDIIMDAATKARDLVRQILTFSRQDKTAVSTIDLSTWMPESLSLLRTLMPVTIKVIESIQLNVGAVVADSAQLQSIILNLGSNAAAAIGNRVGELRIGLSRVQMGDTRTPRTRGLAKGAYARLQVGDSGKGMDEATIAKIFDPFFTTKAPGEGTGLGLSMVHGIVERYGGAIDVTSRVGVGTRFDIYLPLVDTTRDAEWAI